MAMLGPVASRARRIDMETIQKACLDSQDSESHRMLMAELKQAQEAFHAADVGLIKAQGAIEAWSRLLQRRYGLHDGDAVNEDGSFTRKAE